MLFKTKVAVPPPLLSAPSFLVRPGSSNRAGSVVKNYERRT